jgi:copper chaperone CopZ
LWQLLGKGKDDDDESPERRRRYDQRPSPGSNRVYGYPGNGTSERRSGYPRESLDDNYIRNGYDSRASPRGAQPYGIGEPPPRGTEYGSPRGNEFRTPRGTEYGSPRGSEFRTPRGTEYGSPRGSEFQTPRGTEYGSPRGSEFQTPRGTEYGSPRGSEFRTPRGTEYGSPRGTDYRRPYVGSEVASPRGEYVRAPLESPRETLRSPRGSRRDSKESVVEFMVPMCCEKCEEKVKEELYDAEGVESVRCDPSNSRVIVTGDNSIDVERCLKKAERAVKKKCEIINTDAGAGTRDSGRYPDRSAGTRDGTRDGSRMTYPAASASGRPSLGRLPSFASGKVTQYDGLGQDYGAQDYSGSGFRRMPSFNKYRNNEAEYVTSYDQRPQPLDSRREVYTPRRMPSFNRHRHHDAEYITAGDRDDSPRTFYESDAGATYTTAYNERPVYRSQDSFSKLPVENPNYVKHITY